jgi:hypothetical protein
MVPHSGDQYDGIFRRFLGNDLTARDNPRPHELPRFAFTTLREFGNDIGDHYL